jgi:hypothetical protein
MIARVNLAESTTEKFANDDLAGYHYSHLRPRGTHIDLNVAVVPATGGVRTIVCYASPADAAAITDDCDAIRRSLGLRGDRALPLGPIAAYPATVNQVFQQLDNAIRRWRDDLRAARGPVARASVAARLEPAYSVARKDLARAVVSPVDRRVNDGLLTALGRARDAYEAMTNADSSSDVDASNAAYDAVRHAETTWLAQLGYDPG